MLVEIKGGTFLEKRMGYRVLIVGKLIGIWEIWEILVLALLAHIMNYIDSFTDLFVFSASHKLESLFLLSSFSSESTLWPYLLFL